MARHLQLTPPSKSQRRIMRCLPRCSVTYLQHNMFKGNGVNKNTFQPPNTRNKVFSPFCGKVFVSLVVGTDNANSHSTCNDPWFS